MDYYIPAVGCWIVFWVVVLWKWAAIVNEFLDIMYKRKQRPQITKIKCPVNGGDLKDFELFQGHCLRCRTKEKCSVMIVKNKKS